jgi:hypothetical protein
MNVFYEILKRQNENYHNFKTHTTLDHIIKFIFIETIPNCESKFNILKYQIYKNKFLIDSNREYILDLFFRAQKTYHVFLRFVDKIIAAKSHIYDCNTDLCMNPLCEYKDHLLIHIIENKTKYVFKLGDLITLIQMKLSNGSHFFPEPLEIVNPYTNIMFSYKNLYKIYFQCKVSNFTIPSLFHQFFLSNFNIEHFFDFNETLLKEHLIVDFVRYANNRQKYKKISTMIYQYTHHTDYSIYYQSQETMCDTFSYLLIYYLRSEYSINPNVRLKSRQILIKEIPLHLFPSNNYFKFHTVINDRPTDPSNYFLFGQHNEIVSDDESENDDMEF